MKDEKHPTTSKADGPLPNGGVGRDRCGRFAAGNPGGPGNPQARQVARLRSAMLDAVTTKDMAEITRQLVEMAKGGNVAAIREVFSRCLGKPIEADLLDRLSDLEATVNKMEDDDGVAIAS